ncbi:cupin-like domain-containing protein [Pseudomonas wayambapalatensis]|uniref:cupin-like domain-containing protein n=1 Tax=Pseudomonas wayambapalatensis TaxID=485895 RepID=UPI003CEF5780
MLVQSALSSLFARANEVGVAGTFQFVFSDKERFWICPPTMRQAQPGVHPNADVTIELEQSAFIAIMQGLADVEALFAQGRLRIKGRMGLATLLPQLLEAALHPGVSRPGVEMNTRYPAVPRFSEKLSAAVTMRGPVERRPARQVSLEAFTLEYRANGIPLVLTEALEEWPLFKMPRHTAIEYLSDVQGITRHGHYAQKAFSSEREFRTTALRDFAAHIAQSSEHGSEEPPAYMGNNQVPEQWLQLIRFPPYFHHSLYISPRFWLGPKGTLTPLHRDDTDNLFAQVWGEKSMLLAAPHHREALGCWATSPLGGLEGCDFDPDNPDFEGFPAARDVEFLHVHLGPGDLLFLPEGWFHQVTSLSTSLSINFWVNSHRNRAKSA